MRTIFGTIIAAAGLSLAANAAESKVFEIDRSVMSEAYWNLWNDDVLAKIDADIEKHRKADAAVEVAAPDGTEVAVEQLTHAFFFGAHIFNFNQLGTKERNDRYKELYGTLFNSATVAFYWKNLEPCQGQVRCAGSRDFVPPFARTSHPRPSALLGEQHMADAVVDMGRVLPQGREGGS